jgi:cytochrome d ubiquinol oxidase subunit II
MGVAIGNLFLGFPISYDDTMRLTYGTVSNGDYQSMWVTLIHLLTPFALLFGVFALVMALMQGSAYAKLRTSGVVRDRLKAISTITAVVYIVLFVLAGIWLLFIPGFQYTPSANLVHMSDTLNHPFTSAVVSRDHSWFFNFTQLSTIWMWIAPILAVGGAILVIKLNKQDRDGCAVIASTASIFGAVLTFGFALFPFVMPSTVGTGEFSLTVWNASSSQTSLTGILIAAVIILPIIFTYTLFVYKKMWANGRRISADDVKAHSHDMY